MHKTHSLLLQLCRAFIKSYDTIANAFAKAYFLLSHQTVFSSFSRTTDISGAVEAQH